jgi:hypothetical protein
MKNLAQQSQTGLQAQRRKFCDDRDPAISLVIEVAEVLEYFEWQNQDKMKKHLRQTMQNAKKYSTEMAIGSHMIYTELSR